MAFRVRENPSVWQRRSTDRPTDRDVRLNCETRKPLISLPPCFVSKLTLCETEGCAEQCGENRNGSKIIYGLERCLRVWGTMRLQMKKTSQEKKQHREKVTSIVNQLGAEYGA